jgi:phage regulator Rha-like protein
VIVVVSFDSGDGEILVVDSRLVATDLNIEHESFVRTIDSNKTIIESSFGILRSDSDNKRGAGRPEKFFWLTEEQSTFLMTLSRNTPEVILCKANLVKAFFEARDILQKQLNSSLNTYTLQRISLHHSNLEKPLPYGYFACFDKKYFSKISSKFMLVGFFTYSSKAL